MVQFSVQVQANTAGVETAVRTLSERLADSPTAFPDERLLFHLYSSVFDFGLISALISALRDRFPGSRLVFATTTGAAFDYEYQTGIVVAVEAFAHPDSRVEVCAYDLARTTEQEAAEEIAAYVRANPWVKAIKLLPFRVTKYLPFSFKFQLSRSSRATKPCSKRRALAFSTA